MFFDSLAAASGASAKRRKTRKRRPRRGTTQKVQHHHLLVRMEMRHIPTPSDKLKIRHLVQTIIKDIDMKFLGEPRVYYVVHPHYNEGMTALAPIQTSHIAMHFWNNPDPSFMQNAESKYLLEFDIYTCGSLNMQHIVKTLHHLSAFEPTHVNATLLNRARSLTVERQLIWDGDLYGLTWSQWLEHLSTSA